MTAVTDVNEDYQEVTFYAMAANAADAWLMQMDMPSCQRCTRQLTLHE